MRIAEDYHVSYLMGSMTIKNSVRTELGVSGEGANVLPFSFMTKMNQGSGRMTTKSMVEDVLTGAIWSYLGYLHF